MKSKAATAIRALCYHATIPIKEPNPQLIVEREVWRNRLIKS